MSFEPIESRRNIPGTALPARRWTEFHTHDDFQPVLTTFQPLTRQFLTTAFA